MENINLNENENKVLTALENLTLPDGELCITFDYISDEADLDRKEVRKACRSLARKGLAGYYRGLMTEDGEVAGSGYSITYAGRDFVDNQSKNE